MKRIIIACDGTWQSLTTPEPTNVRRLVEAVAPTDDAGRQQLIYYGQGLGTRGRLDRWLGGAFGHGLNRDIKSAYSFLCSNYSVGDEIYLFGYSRGAYLARSLAGFIHRCGILRREHLSQLPAAFRLYRRQKTDATDHDAKRFQVAFGHGQTSQNPHKSSIRITFLGCWDTVGALGVPDVSGYLSIDRLWRGKVEFHDTCLSPLVDTARHAVAIDERRRTFRHTEMNPPTSGQTSPHQIKQIWFPGPHGAIGGGGDRRRGAANSLKPHADAALKWMVEELADRLPAFKIDKARLNLRPNPLSPLGRHSGRFTRRMSDPTAGTAPKRPQQDQRPFCSVTDVHPAALQRWQADPTYRPSNLKDVIDNQLAH